MPSRKIKKTKKTRKHRKSRHFKIQKGGKLCGADPKPTGIAENGDDTLDIYTIGEEHPEASNWMLYTVAEDPHLLVKKVGGVGWKSKEEIKTEFEIAREAARLGLGPAIRYSRLCINEAGRAVGFLVMEKIEGRTISKPEEIAAANALLKTFNDNGFEHRDTHYKNAMWGSTVSHPGERAWIIDFDRSRKVPEGTTAKKERFKPDAE